MPKELYLYSPVYDFIAEDLISRMEESAGEDIVLRINSPGGSVFAGWGIIAKLKEATGKITAKVDGYAASMSAFMLLFIDQVEALDTSTFILHRADMYVSTPEDQEFLDNINKDLRKKMSAKLNFAKLKELKGVGVDELFDPTKRIDVVLNAKDAKAIGLINKINKVAPAEVKAINDKYYQIAATTASTTIHTPNNNTMTFEKLKAEHPDVYNAILAEGEKAGAKKELARVTSHLQFLDVEPKKVIEAITKGEVLTAEQTTEYTTLRISKNVLAKITEANPSAVTTAETAEEKTAKEKQNDDFLAEALSILNVKGETKK